MTDIVVPSLGESVTTATVARWLKKAGEAVAADEPVVELETDKVTVEVNASTAGVMQAPSVDAGAEVEVGTVLGSITPSGADGKPDPRAHVPRAEPAPVKLSGARAGPGILTPPPPDGPVARPAAVLEAVHKKVEELNSEVLPKDVKIVPYYDRTELVNTTLHTVIHNLIEGGVLVIVVLLVFLLSMRGALVVATVIPLSLLTSFAYLKARGMSANLLSMGAVDFGILVDGAVVIVENVFARLGHRKEGEDPQDTIRRATIEVAKPTLFSLAIIIVAYVPIFTLQRVEGRIFSPMANTVASALVGALLFSLTLVPVLCSLTLANAKEKESPVVRLAEHLYMPSLGWVLRHRAVTVLAAMLALGASMWLLVRKVGSEFLPDLNEGILWVTATLPPEISLEEAQRSLPHIETALKSFPEVKTVVAQVGRPEDGTDAKAVNNIEMLVDLRPLSTWTTAPTVDGLIEKMSKRVHDDTLAWTSTSPCPSRTTSRSPSPASRAPSPSSSSARTSTCWVKRPRRSAR